MNDSTTKTAFVQLTTTTGTREDAERIGEAMVRKRLAACAQIEGPIVSFYWWKGNLERAEEYRCTMKTTMVSSEPLMKAIQESHPYETPEIVAVPLCQGEAAYLRWIEVETLPGSFYKNDEPRGENEP